MKNYHEPVLKKEVLDLLQIKPGAKVIDATLGGGGHTFEILRGGAKVLGIDQDEDAINEVKNELKTTYPQFERGLVLAKGNFRELDKIAKLNGFNRVYAVLFDLGVSSHQIDTPDRGFSFLKDGPLDMRMDKSQTLTAEYLVNLLGKDELSDIFLNLGGESRAQLIAKQILVSRKLNAIRTTGQLSKVIQEAYGIKGEISDFTKNKLDQKVFQGLRIAVNSELESLEEALPKALQILQSKGRLAVISFHSLEDRVVKQTFLDFENKNMGKIITKEIIKAGFKETELNSRAKSAVMRVFEKN